jgi:hypothetical protein
MKYRALTFCLVAQHREGRTRGIPHNSEYYCVSIDSPFLSCARQIIDWRPLLFQVGREISHSSSSVTMNCNHWVEYAVTKWDVLSFFESNNVSSLTKAWGVHRRCFSCHLIPTGKCRWSSMWTIWYSLWFGAGIEMARRLVPRRCAHWDQIRLDFWFRKRVLLLLCASELDDGFPTYDNLMVSRPSTPLISWIKES